ncbi:uncharacterized protein [Rutidosis leptorrhynchoides]|uniref:uncharacterized protein n=1 Tax=Rutidosis leptorrhynchoides TaxID=125765 RepID=UPI003A998A75
MVLWELTLATAYFLGLKRTYRLALKIQRRVITPKHPKIRKFVHGRTRMIFDVALKVHRNVQERDLEVGRNVGNRILRWLDRMKPSANIRRPHQISDVSTNTKMTKQSSSLLKPPSSSSLTSRNDESGRHLFTASKAMWRSRSTTFPAIAMMMRAPRPAGTMTHYRHLSSSNYSGARFEGIIRKDIMQWMLQN